VEGPLAKGADPMRSAFFDQAAKQPMKSAPDRLAAA
jgi:hypothetical protein